jgi:hypothetical protein
MVTVITLAGVFVPRSLPCSADRAEELHKRRDAKPCQAEQRQQTAACERAVTGAHFQFVAAVVYLHSDSTRGRHLSVTESGLFTFLPTVSQQQRVSAVRVHSSARLMR